MGGFFTHPWLWTSGSVPVRASCSSTSSSSSAGHGLGHSSVPSSPELSASPPLSPAPQYASSSASNSNSREGAQRLQESLPITIQRRQSARRRPALVRHNEINPPTSRSPRRPSHLLSASPDLQDALEDLTHSSAHLQRFVLTTSPPQQGREPPHDEAWRAERRSYLGLELERTDFYVDAAMERNGECIDRRLEKALRFSEWAKGNTEMPEGLSSALDLLLADDDDV